MDDKLEVKTSTAFKPQVRGLAAIKQKAKAELAKEGVIIIDPAEMQHRIGIVFDDSISMGYEQNQDAIAGTEEFLRSCVQNETAVAIKPLNMDGLQLNSNLPAVAIYVKGIESTGGTPLVTSLRDMLIQNNLTRAIVFSDGIPNRYEDSAYEAVLEFKVPVDTVYIPDEGSINERAVFFMKKLAEDTGGIYLQFERGKSNFRTAFKYLSPGLRHMLMDKSFVEKLEGR